MEPRAIEPRGAAAGKITRNAEASRTRILDAARIEFVTHGLSGARVDSIAERSGVNKNLIYHYFGSKDALYVEILERVYSELRASQRDEDLRDLPPAEGMRRLIKRTFDHFLAAPDLVRLMSIENIHYGRYLKRSKVVKMLYPPLLETIRTLLARGQATGVFRQGVDVIDLYLSIAALAYFNLSNQHTLSWLFDEDLSAPARLARRRRHVVDMVLAYLQQAGEDGAVNRRRKTPRRTSRPAA